MKRFVLPLALIAVAALFALPFTALADSPDLGVPSLSEWYKLYESLGQMKGLTTLGAVTVIVQGALLFARSSFDPLPGPAKLLVVTALNLILGVLGLKATTGMDWATALMHSTTLASFQVFANQIWQQVQSASSAQRGAAAVSPGAAQVPATASAQTQELHNDAGKTPGQPLR